jgi:hypothetical protein
MYHAPRPGVNERRARGPARGVAAPARGRCRMGGMKALWREAPLLLLLAYGAAFAVVAFGRGVPGFDDHPGQLFRLWHALDRSLPAAAWTADWNPDWWGGYPELQFYPPGFALLGAVVRAALLWRPDVETTYRVLCAIVLVAPALTTYALVARVLGDRWLALPPAFLALVLSAHLPAGVEAGVRWGTLTSRLAAAWLPLLALALRPWIEAGRRPRWAPPVAALAVLSHPSALPAVAVLTGTAAALAAVARPGRRTAAEAGAVAGLAALLGAFWTLPFVARRGWVVPLAWGDLAAGPVADAAGRPVLLAVAAGAALAWVAVALRRRPMDAFLATLPVALALVLLADAWLFRRGWSVIEPARLLDALAHAALWAAGLTAGLAVARLVPARVRHGRALAALAICAAAAVLPEPAPGPPTLLPWPSRARWPTLAEIGARHDLGRLWDALRGGADRVLFVTSGVRLDRDPAWHAPHSHVTSLAPLRAGREIVGGTYTHPSPVAARFYAGRLAPAGRLDALAERLDGERLLGERWDRLSPAAFDRFARRLRVGTVVVPLADVPRARFLGPLYRPTAEAAGFAVFERGDRPWPRVERITSRRYRVLVSPTGGVWIPTGIPAYPLWAVKSAAGRLETRADEWGLLEFRVPVDLFEAELVYREGWLEWGALALSAAGAAAWLAWVLRARTAAPARSSSRSAPGRRRR